MAVVYLQDKKGNWKKYNEFIAFIILLVKGRKSDVQWICEHWMYATCTEIRIPYNCKEGEINVS